MSLPDELRQPNEEIEYDIEKQKEFYYCAKSIKYFAKRYCLIEDAKKDEEDNNILYPYQEEFFDDMMTHYRYILNCARQVGKSTIISIVIIHYVLFNKNRNVGILSKDGYGARKIVLNDKIKRIYKNLPKFLQQGVIDWNKNFISLENGCRIEAFPAHSQKLDGSTMDFLYLDEFAKFTRRQADNLITTVMPTIANKKESIVCISSTPRGLNHYYEHWVSAKDFVKKGERDIYYKRKKVIWSDIPGRNERWKKKQLTNLKNDMDKFEQEYECKFKLKTQDSVFQNIPFDEKKSIKELYKDKKNTFLYIWEKPIFDRRYYYVGGIDVAEGYGGCNTSFNIFKFDKMTMKFNQVLKFSTNEIDVNDLDADIDYIYKKIMGGRLDKLIIENNSFGREVIDNLLDLDEDYYEIMHKEKKNENSYIWGVRTTKNKKIMINDLRYLLNEEYMSIHSSQSATELGLFVKKGNVYKSRDDSTTDDVMSFVMVARFTKSKEYEAFKKMFNEGNYEDMRKENKEYDLPMIGIGNKRSDRSIYEEGNYDDYLMNTSTNFIKNMKYNNLRKR